MRDVCHNWCLIGHANAHLLDGNLTHVGVPRDRDVVRQSSDFARFTLEISTPQRFQEGIAESDTGNDLDGGALLVGQVGAQKGLGRSCESARDAFRLAE